MGSKNGLLFSLYWLLFRRCYTVVEHYYWLPERLRTLLSFSLMDRAFCTIDNQLLLSTAISGRKKNIIALTKKMIPFHFSIWWRESDLMNLNIATPGTFFIYRIIKQSKHSFHRKSMVETSTKQKSTQNQHFLTEVWVWYFVILETCFRLSNILLFCFGLITLKLRDLNILFLKANFTKTLPH